MLYPGRIDNYLGIGVNNLIREEGAILTCKIEDILKYYPQFAKEKRLEAPRKMQICVNNKILKKQYLIIIQIIREGNYYINDILDKCEQVGLEDMNYVLETLGLMELEGIIKRDYSGGYRIAI